MSDVKKVVLAYSGGLDTSVILKWLQDTYQCEVVTFTADLGQGEELEPARAKALQFGIKAANYPLIPEDFERNRLPEALHKFRHKLFGLTITPERLSSIRQERRPDSTYAAIDNCRWEIGEAQKMMRREGVRWLDSTTKSIEEISATLMQTIKLDRRAY